MANICLYKIKVRGTRDACYALINMMPLYSWEKEILSEEGTDADCTLVFTGACKWGVHAYTSKRQGLTPYTPEQVAAVKDGDGWDICLEDKSLLLSCELWCNSKDIDDYCYSDYEHYNKGERIFDECPKELHIKRGRDYDQGFDAAGNLITGDYEPLAPQNSYKIRFDNNKTYWYLGESANIEACVGDVVYVNGACAGIRGVVKEISSSDTHPASQQIVKNTGINIDLFRTDEIDALWDTFGKAKERKEHFVKIGLDPALTRKKFLSIVETMWVDFAHSNNDWNAFVATIKK